MKVRVASCRPTARADRFQSRPQRGQQQCKVTSSKPNKISSNNVKSQTKSFSSSQSKQAFAVFSSKSTNASLIVHKISTPYFNSSFFSTKPSNINFKTTTFTLRATDQKFLPSIIASSLWKSQGHNTKSHHQHQYQYQYNQKRYAGDKELPDSKHYEKVPEDTVYTGTKYPEEMEILSEMMGPDRDNSVTVQFVFTGWLIIICLGVLGYYFLAFIRSHSEPLTHGREYPFNNLYLERGGDPRYLTSPILNYNTSDTPPPGAHTGPYWTPESDADSGHKKGHH